MRHSVKTIETALLFLTMALGCTAIAQQPPAQKTPAVGAKQTHHANRDGTAPSVLDSDEEMFAAVTQPIAPELPSGSLIVRAIEKNPRIVVHTRTFEEGSDLLLSPGKAVLKPRTGVMLVRLIFDLYVDTSAPLWDDEVAFVGKNGTVETPVQLSLWVNNPVIEVSYGGLNLEKGGNRIAALFAVKSGEPSAMRLQLRGKDRGTLSSLMAR
jgi:hypothetical protein